MNGIAVISAANMAGRSTIMTFVSRSHWEDDTEVYSSDTLE